MDFSILPPYLGHANEASAKDPKRSPSFDDVFGLVSSSLIVGIMAFIVLAYVLAFGSGPLVQN